VPGDPAVNIAENGEISMLLRPRQILSLLAFSLLVACEPEAVSTDKAPLEDFAIRYAAAWSSQDPAALASFYAEDGSLTVNDGTPAVGREAVEATARAFMSAFPDMVVRFERLELNGERLVFHWHWTGTNTGPGGTGNAVDIRGYEEWTLNEDGQIEQSLGHYDDAEYQRQVNAN
jgi:steroid delta-isomerase-like uncharacterized protein